MPEADSRNVRCLVLMAAYNGAPHIREQLDSILAQESVDVSILVSDDNSTDGTVHIVSTADLNGRIRTLRRSPGTGSAAQNFVQTICEADGTGYDFVALSDHDDVWMPGKLRRATFLLQASGAGGYSSSVIAKWPDGKQSVFRQSPDMREADFLFEGGGQGCTFVLTISLFERVRRVLLANRNLTAALVYHDWAIYALARAFGTKWEFDAAPTMWYRQHGGNDTGARGDLAGLRRRLTLLSDGRYGKQISTIATLCSRVAPNNPILEKWSRIQAGGNGVNTRIKKANFSWRYGRRRHLDRIATSFFALAGWI